jgi:quinol monooxygenase YgiN
MPVLGKATRRQCQLMGGYLHEEKVGTDELRSGGALGRVRRTQKRIEKILREFVPRCRAEPVCRSFVAHQSIERPNEFLLYEHHGREQDFVEHPATRTSKSSYSNERCRCSKTASACPSRSRRAAKVQRSTTVRVAD